jgi:hypothetical protein
LGRARPAGAGCPPDCYFIVILLLFFNYFNFFFAFFQKTRYIIIWYVLINLIRVRPQKPYIFPLNCRKEARFYEEIDFIGVGGGCFACFGERVRADSTPLAGACRPRARRFPGGYSRSLEGW